MKSFVALALAGSALAVPHVSSRSECSDSRSGKFQLQISNVTSSSKRSIEKRQLDGALTVTLADGVLKDQAGRQAEIVANHQFQFDSPLQETGLATTGFGICSNGSLTHGGSAIWYQCLSGTFYNLYDESLGEQCNAIYITAVGSSSAPVTQISDGQPGASTQVPISQISDGQPQAPTSAVVISQISDGQIQAPTGVVISQISDGQIQAPTGVVISQISDGQIQAPTTAAVISQISDGQPQAPTAVRTTAAVISQISDGQPQAPLATANTTHSSNFTVPNATAPATFVGAASLNVAGIGALAAALLAMVAML